MLRVVMTTCDRVDLLKDTVKSLVAADQVPERMDVFDDQSAQAGDVAAALAQLPAFTFRRNKERLGCDANTPTALATIFTEDATCEAVVILDSDVLVSKGWWADAVKYAEVLAKDERIAAIQLLNLVNIWDKKPYPDHTNLLECSAVTACGLIVTRRFWQDFIKSQQGGKWQSWDMEAGAAAKARGLKVCCLKGSAIQHMGNEVGTHVGPGQVSHTFCDVSDTRLIFKEPKQARIGSVTLVCGRGFNNVAVAIVVADALSKCGVECVVGSGHPKWDEVLIAWLGVNRVVDLSCYFPVQFNDVISLTDARLAQCMRNVGAPINLDLKHDENAWRLYAMQNDLSAFLVARMAAAVGVDLAEKMDWSILQTCPNPRPVAAVPGAGCVVVNNLEGEGAAALSKAGPQITAGRLRTLQWDRPQVAFREAKEKYLFQMSPIEIVQNVQAAKAFVSVDGDSVLLGLFSSCEKLVAPAKSGTGLWPKARIRSIAPVGGGYANGPARLGIAVSTYFGPDTHPDRLEICRTSIYTLLASEFPGKIVIVDDGSTTIEHLREFVNNPAITVVYKRNNRGVACSKNTGLRLLSDCDYVFLADDDMIYNGAWWSGYVEAHQKTGIGYFAFMPTKEEYPQYGWDGQAANCEGVVLKKLQTVSGCLVSVATDAVRMVGGFKALPYRFGYEHLNFALRMVGAGRAPFYCDVASSNEWLHLNIASNNAPSLAIDTKRVFDQLEIAMAGTNLVEPLTE